MVDDKLLEKKRQEQFPWERSAFYDCYNKTIGYYQYVACLENVKAKNVLDLACGDGTITTFFGNSFERVVAIDASGQHLEKAREKNPRVTFHESLIETFVTDEKFDAVFMLNLLEHVEDPILILQKAASFLAKKGRLIVHVPNANAINRKIAVKMGTLKTCEELSPFDIHVAGHRRSYTLDTFKADIQSAGLKILKTGGVFFKMLSTPQMDWFLKNGLWEEGGFGWGRIEDASVGKKDWRQEFCRACYEIGKDYPEECNVIYAVIVNQDSDE